MMEYRYKIAGDIQAVDVMQICSIPYEVIMTRPRSVNGEEKYIQVFARIQGSDPKDQEADITIVFPMWAVIKVKARKKHRI